MSTADPDVLLQKIPADGSTIGNQRLRDDLGWDETRYAAARDALVANGTLVKGQGRGGTVRRSTSTTLTATHP